MRHEAVTLGDKYDLAKSRILVTGTQAVVRLALTQRARDRRMGKRTAGYITGYRGSPLGGLDQQFERAASLLKPADILFQPAVNEDLAATALWGSQQAEMRGEGRYRRRLRHLVRQGAGRRPLGRRAQARQPRRHLAVGRRRGADGRRPHLRILDHRAPVGIRLRRRA